MPNLLRACGLAVCVLLLTSRANAAVPSDTGSFVAYCTDANFESCRSEVVDIDNINVMKQIGGTYSCAYPHPGGTSSYHADSIAATKAILVWLEANPTKRLPNSGPAIDQAMAALWPYDCQK
ncbi:MAG: hypothetical protein WCC73_05690 [Terracidiphilus sp.]